MRDVDDHSGQRSRRAFVRDGSLYLLGAGVCVSQVTATFADNAKPSVRVGLVTDLHYADKDAAGSRHYRESLTKLNEAAEHFAMLKPDAIVELGDFVDAAESVDVELGYLKRVNKVFAAMPGTKHYVLGNHCVHTLTKDEFLGGVGQAKSFYSFDQGGFHFVVLDACFRGDGTPYGRKNFQWTDPNIPADEVEWLKSDLAATKKQTIVLVHQRLDVSNNYGIKNAAAVRRVLEGSGKVLAVFQGHSHKNDYREIGGIHYCVMKAMVEGSGVENNGYSSLEIMADGSMRVTGVRQQKSYAWS